MTIEAPLGEESSGTKSAILTEKLASILADPLLNLELGSYLDGFIIPAKVNAGRLTKEQGRYLLQVSTQTLEASLTPEQIARAEQEARNRCTDKPSPFARW